MDKLREIELKGGDFEVIRLAEDYAFLGTKSESLDEYFRKTELQKLKDGKELIESWEKATEESWGIDERFLVYYGFEYEVKTLVI